MKIGFWGKLLLSGVLVSLVFTLAVSYSYSEPPGQAVFAVAVPRNVPTLIVDPGHGGADGGAVSVTGTYESKINLDIALKIEEIAGFFGMTPVLTRSTEELTYPESAGTIRAKKVADQKARAALINSMENAVLISIQQNKYTSPGPSGSQVFYAPTGGSDGLAVFMQETLLSQVSPTNRRTASKIPDSIYLLNNIQCPAVLIECGFVSNPTEAQLLEDAAYQTKLAAIILGSYLGFYS